jgi:hypothetical protein
MDHESYLLVLLKDSTPISKPVTLFFSSDVSDQVGTTTNNFNDLVRVNGNLHPLIFWKPGFHSYA